MKTWRKLSILLLGVVIAPAELTIDGTGPSAVSLLPVAPAEARVGRPLTPLSYAGVARRTSRRVARRTAVRVSTLPAGCVYGSYYGAYYYRCGSAYYQRSSGVYVKVVFD